MKLNLATLAVAFGAFSIAFAADAPVVTNNPVSAQYLAKMPASGDPGVDAQFAVMSDPGGEGVMFTININGKVFEGGPFLYHIHDQPVPANGNCTATTAHLDPYGRGEDPPCDKNNPASCQVGDLSGKYGTIPALPGFSANYTDKYLSLAPGDPAFFGNRSVVLHHANKTRIACANFSFVEKKRGSSNSTTNSTIPSPSGGYIGSGTLVPTIVAPTGPASTAGGPSVPTPSPSALSAATGIKVKHAKVVLGPVLLGLACMV